MVRLALAAAAAGFAFVPVATASAAVTLNGGGSTLVAPIEAEWASTWDGSTGNTVTYNAQGSTFGENGVANGTLNFGGSDAPLAVYTAVPCTGCIMLPWALTATGVSFNVKDTGGHQINNLKLTGGILDGIYDGHIRHWNDSAIKRVNPGVALPSSRIAPFYRSDGSGDSYAFTNYLSKYNGDPLGPPTTAFHPPAGAGAPKNSGMVSAVQQTPNSIAYIAVSYIINAGLPAAQLYNRAHKYQYPNLSNIEAAALAAGLSGDWQHNGIDLTFTTARLAYPISTFTYLMAPPKGRLKKAQAGALRNFAFYALHGGQRFGPSLDFAKIPSNVLNAADGQISHIQ
jgi:phosphate transport system substrate-binding protein